jgi:hypothetical protein
MRAMHSVHSAQAPISGWAAPFCGARRPRAPDWGTPDGFPRSLLHGMPSQPDHAGACLADLESATAVVAQLTACLDPANVSRNEGMRRGAKLLPAFFSGGPEGDAPSAGGVGGSAHPREYSTQIATIAYLAQEKHDPFQRAAGRGCRRKPRITPSSRFAWLRGSPA